MPKASGRIQEAGPDFLLTHNLMLAGVAWWVIIGTMTSASSCATRPTRRLLKEAFELHYLVLKCVRRLARCCFCIWSSLKRTSYRIGMLWDIQPIS
ncbi:hypothetical protein Pyn_07830 [Prunus yedoensis var. nudiflora]|uniref:Uncharacterized protein n=1 Tax=Prunus yedoensis var. nudiflora TaxID=2094558 RepID=A0A314ZHR7_PRUYE|nr:hypothetical protein Pyn_07830 [Prunus yedoensis var. nudiflora]